MRALVVVAALALAGCQSAQVQKVDTTIDQTFPVVCAGINVAWLGWEAAGVKVDDKTSAKLKAAYVTAEGICLNPPTNTAEALAAVLKSYSAFNAALRAAKNGGNTGASSFT